MHRPPSSNRILITRLSAHGDVMHALPLLSALKQADPTAYVGWLVEASAAPLLKDHPLIDQLHVAHRKRWMRLAMNPLRWPWLVYEVVQFVCGLRQAGYGVSLDAQGLFKSAIWPWLALIPHRYGFASTREQAAIFYNHRLAPRNIRGHDKLAVEEYRDLARALGYTVGEPAFVTPPATAEARQRVDRWLASRVSPGQPVVVLAPFTRWESKHWLPVHWSTLMTGLHAESTRMILLGAPGDQAMAGQMLSAVAPDVRDAVINLVGQTDWPDLYALFARTDLVIGLDSAPMHVANAVGIPALIGIFGSTAAGRTGPVGVRHRTFSANLACQPCFERHCPLKTHACMHAITPEAVLEAARGYLTGAPVRVADVVGLGECRDPAQGTPE